MDLMGLLPILLLLGPAAPVLKRFYYFDTLMNHTEATSYCTQRFAELAIVERAEDWVTVKAMIAQSGESEVWIGLFDDVKNWTWSLDGTLLYDRDYGSWFVFEEDNYISTQYCGALHQGKLKDVACDSPGPSLCYDEGSNSFIPVTDAKSWQSAQSYCRQTYTDLASIRDQQEWNAAMSLVDSAQVYFVGLSRQGWRWPDQRVSSFLPWRSGQPHGGTQVCTVAGVGGWLDHYCNIQRTFICSAPATMVLKVALKTHGSVNLNDPLVQEAFLKQMEENVREQGILQFNLEWKRQLHGDVFNMTSA